MVNEVVVGVPRWVMFPEEVPAYTVYPVTPLTLLHVTAMEAEVIVPAARPEGAAGNGGLVFAVIGLD